MPAPLNAALAATFSSPIELARDWARDIPAGQPLINLSQAAPADPPPEALRHAMVEAVLKSPAVHSYGPTLGLPTLRAAIAERWSEIYRAPIGDDAVAVTAGCNMAFVAAALSVARAREAVLLPTPWYFNHKMYLDMAGITARLMPVGPTLLPDLDLARRLITPEVRAMVLVSPNNPTGQTCPPGLIRALADLARDRNCALILDETYRDLVDGAPHDVFADPDWGDVLIHLYSFSKVYRLTGHRTGAIVAAPDRIQEIAKILDTVSICAPQLGQVAALHGLRHLGAFVEAERDEVRARQAAAATLIDALPGWEVHGIGAYFAWAAHPFDLTSTEVCRALLARAGLLMLPGAMFAPPTDPFDGIAGAERMVRIAFANASIPTLETAAARLREIGSDLRRLPG